jgi:hypothetical protein
MTKSRKSIDHGNLCVGGPGRAADTASIRIDDLVKRHRGAGGRPDAAPWRRAHGNETGR